MSENNWIATLDLELQNIDGHSRLINPSHKGPLRVQRPFYPEGKSPAHIYILHPPAGVVGGDQLFINCRICEGAAGLFTTPGATKIYRSDAKEATIHHLIDVKQKATLEWLPQETIIFNGAYANCTTRVNLEKDSNFIGWDIVCFGRPGANEIFDIGCIKTNFELWRNDLPIWLDKGLFSSQGKGNSIFTSNWGLNSSPVMATFIATSCTQQLSESLPKQSLTKGHCSITLVEDILVCRYIGSCTQEARNYFISIWSKVRPALLDRSPCPPRVWNT